MSRVGILRFPGTNCDRDCWQSVEKADHEPHWLWHKDRFDFKDFDAFIVPGGFSYGDYLRSGALAALSPVMSSLIEAANQGYPIFGICNGFQVLCEAQLLPGALLRNEKGRFVDKWVNLNLENPSRWSPFEKGQYRMPMAHADGRFFVTNDEHKQLQDSQQIWLTYQANPNGSVGDIAGVTNKAGNVAAMMPHPDRANAPWMGSTDGLQFFQWQEESK